MRSRTASKATNSTARIPAQMATVDIVLLCQLRRLLLGIAAKAITVITDESATHKKSRFLFEVQSKENTSLKTP